MKWFTAIWQALKDLLAPVVAYFFGKKVERLQNNVDYLEVENQLMKRRREREKKLHEKYKRIRDDIDSIIKSSELLTEEGDLKPINDNERSVSSNSV